MHGDVSPGNILLTTQGHVLLADLAGAADPSAGGPSGSPGEDATRQHFFGSVGYAAPEALRGLSMDGRSDLFSLGCVLYEMLCGSPAFDADDERSVICQVLEQEPTDVRQRAPEVPAELAAVLRRALQRRVDQRFQSAEELRSALCECVRAQSAFRLEERSSSLIQRVLGERLRTREAEMSQVFQRFSVSQFERTDTLPIASGSGAPATATLRTRAAESLSDSAAGVWRSSSVAAPIPPKPARWGFWALLLVALTLAGGYLVQARGHAPGLEAAVPVPAQPASAGPPGAGPEPPLEQVLLAARPHPDPDRGKSPPSGSGPLPVPPSADVPTGVASHSAAVAPAPTPRRPAGERRRPLEVPPNAAASATPEASPPARQPFQWNFPPDPYQGTGPAAAPKPAPDTLEKKPTPAEAP